MDAMDDLKQAAQDFIHQMVEGDYTGACRLFDSNLIQAFPEAKVKETWLQLIGQVGPFQEILGCQAVDKQENHIVTVSCQFEKATIDFRVVFNQSGQMSGLNYQLASDTSPYNPPAYVHAAAFHEIEVTVGSGEWALPGTLEPAGGRRYFPGRRTGPRLGPSRPG